MNVKCLLACLLIPMLLGCASTSIKKQNKQLSKLELGMTEEQVLQIMPGGVPKGAKPDSDGSVTAVEYEARHYAPFDEKADAFSSRVIQKTWLYFYHGKLLKVGQPHDWPDNPDAGAPRP